MDIMHAVTDVRMLIINLGKELRLGLNRSFSFPRPTRSRSNSNPRASKDVEDISGFGAPSRRYMLCRSKPAQGLSEDYTQGKNMAVQAPVYDEMQSRSRCVSCRAQ